MDSQTLTQDRFTKITERTAKIAGWGQTDAARGVSAHYLSHMAERVCEARGSLKRLVGRPKLVMDLPDQLIALVGLATGISAVVDGETLAHMPLSIGRALELECYGYGLKNWDKVRAEQILQKIKKDHQSIVSRKTAMRQLAQKAAFRWTNWTASEKARAGTWLLGVMLESEAFVLDTEGRFCMTQEAVDIAGSLVSDLMNHHPCHLPSMAPPEPWTKAQTDINGYPVSLVRSRDVIVQKNVKAAIRDGRMADSLEAINQAQAVPYRINQPILETIKWCYEKGIKVPGMPSQEDIPMPPRATVVEAMNPDKLRAVRKARRDIKMLNRSFIGERLQIHQDIATAEHIGDQTFYTPMNFDYRGRVYGIPRFNFQRQDYVRALFQFEEGQRLDADGLYWLKVHVANCGDFGKISKQPFGSREDWFDANWEALVGYADDPQEDFLWTEADKPFLFLAGCMAYRDHCLGLNVHLPIAFDGSCSGLQHLGAMTRCEATSVLVNLEPNSKPQDVYQVVADLSATRMMAEGDPEKQEVAATCLAYGVDRKLVKRNVMTFSYSSKEFGMSEQHMEDTMVPLNYEVLAGKLEKHPLETSGDTWTNKEGKTVHVAGLRASKYLAKVVYGAIKDTVSRPAEAMGFLQGIARTLSHEGKPVVWHTPLGFPVTMRYPVVTTEQLSLLLSDKGVKIRLSPRVAVEGSGIDKRRATSAIAPSFVHSLDAAHLMAVVLDAKDVGINSVALVHDSFGCLPNEAGRFRKLIKQAFCDMYANHDVLFDVLREAAGQLDTNWYRLPNLPEKGTYDIQQINLADYAFA